jgi:diguanylate cyclase (GGDEF)-like protein
MRGARSRDGTTPFRLRGVRRIVLGGARNRDWERSVAKGSPKETDAFSMLDAFALASSVGIGFVDRDFRIICMNSALATAIGSSVEEQIGGSAEAMVPALWSQLNPVYRSVLDRDEPVTNIEIVGPAPDDPSRPHYWRAHFYPVKVAGDITGIGIVAVDATEGKELESQLRDQSLRDALTGLPNRALLLDRAQQLIEMAGRTESPVSVLFMDLDNFKTINDGLGHHAGDELLVAVARRLKSAMRSEDTVCRFGDDEFVVLANPQGTYTPPHLMAERITDVLRAPFELDGHELSVSASIGIASGRDVTAEELIRNAHIAMYKAKVGGKNATVTFTPPMQVVAVDHFQLEIDLRRAVENNEFSVLYQPTIDLRTNVPTGAEALVRWEHPSRGCLSPSEFLPLAEETGIILDVGRLVLRASCGMAATWQRRGSRLSIAVNISTRQLESADLLHDVREILSETQLNPGSLILEVTETTFMRDVELVIERLKSLKRLGVRLAIDDFGTGYSSLSYLRQFPVDIVKIDRSFVSGLQDSVEQQSIVHALIELGKAVDLEMIAEGVELEVQLNILKRERCAMAQGYLFAPPLTEEDFARFMDGWRPGTPRP